MKLNHILTEQLDGVKYQIVDSKTGDLIGKPSENGRRLRRKADKMDLEYGAVRYVVRLIREWDRSDLELAKQVDRRKQAQADKTRDRDEFRAKMRDKEGQSLQAGDRVYSRKNDKMYVVKRVTSDGVLFKGAERPVKINTKDTGRKTDLGHRVFMAV